MATAKTQKTAAKPSNTPDVGAMVDELGAIEKALLPFDAKIKRAEALRRSIRDQYDVFFGHETFEPSGSRFVAMIGCKAFKSHINIKAVAKAIGAKAFYTIASCTLESLKAFPAAAAAVTQSRTGTRSLVIHEKAAPAA